VQARRASQSILTRVNRLAGGDLISVPLDQGDRRRERGEGQGAGTVPQLPAPASSFDVGSHSPADCHHVGDTPACLATDA